jgi:hypothetical protein
MSSTNIAVEVGKKSSPQVHESQVVISFESWHEVDVRSADRRVPMTKDLPQSWR